MKRVRCEERECPPFTDLPDDIQERIILTNKACEVARVSKFWFSVVQSYPDWYENIRTTLLKETMRGRMVYLVDYSKEPQEAESVVSIPAMMEDIDRECASYHQEFKNRLGLYLRRAFIVYMRDGDKEKRQGSLMFNSIYTYLRHSKPNASLTIKNFHPYDFRINFYDRDHRYNLIGKRGIHYSLYTNIPATKLTLVDRLYKVYASYLTSTTAFIEPLFSPFVEDVVIDKMMNSRNWKNSSYFGLTRQEIKDMWELARVLGTKMHANIEAYYCGRVYSVEGVEWVFFSRFEAKFVTGILIPYRSEWLIYSLSLRMTGSVDMLYAYVDPEKSKRDADGYLHLKMCDWKRAKDLLKENTFQNGSKPCTAHIQDSKKSHYWIQVLWYSFLLLAYGIKIDEWFLVGMHPDQRDYIKVDYEWDQVLVDNLVQYRKECLGVGADTTTVSEFLNEPGAKAVIKKRVR
jgi:hypothetical protein